MSRSLKSEVCGPSLLHVSSAGHGQGSPGWSEESGECVSSHNERNIGGKDHEVCVCVCVCVSA